MMNSHELFGADMLKAFDAATAPVNEAGILPPILYTSSEFYRFERDTIFTKEWLCVGRTSQIPDPGDWYQFTLLDEPLLVVRDRDGQVRVLSAVCQHRGMVVAEGSGNCNKFLCPYHHWSYALDGRLLGMPEMDKAVGFDKTQYNLPSLRRRSGTGLFFAALRNKAMRSRRRWNNSRSCCPTSNWITVTQKSAPPTKTCRGTGR